MIGTVTRAPGRRSHGPTSTGPTYDPRYGLDVAIADAVDPQGLILPLSFVTSRQAILAKTRVGKSYTGQVQAEELLRLQQQMVALDPTGVWYGLRSSADGNSAGYEIAVFGGDHGDVELAPTSGAELAGAVVSERFSAIFDLSLFTPDELTGWVRAFCETLYRLNRDPIHLFADEADAYAPQKPETSNEHKALAAMDRIVRRGGVKGIGCTLISQRASLLNKNVLSQVEMVTVLRMTHPLDLKQVMNWVNVHAEPALAKDMLASLPSLRKGEAWVWNPEIDLFKQVQIRRKTTFDSGKTPVAGQEARPPKVLAPVDLARLGKAIAATVERTKANDPAVLKRRIVELEKALAVPRPAMHLVDKDALDRAFFDGSSGAMVHAQKHVDQYLSDLRGRFDHVHSLLAQAVPIPFPVAVRRPAGDREREPNGGAFGDGRGVSPALIDPDLNPSWRQPPAPTDAPRRSRGERSPQDRILGALAWWAAMRIDEPSNTQVAFVARYSPNSSTYKNRRGELKAQGLLDYPHKDGVSITDAGRAVAPAVTDPTTMAELHRIVLEQLSVPQAAILQALITAYPESLTNDELAARVEYSPDSSTYKNRRGEVKSLGLLCYPQKDRVKAAGFLFDLFPPIGRR